MSLANLLSVGRSLTGTREEASRFKLGQPGALPKFAPVGRPVSLAPAVEGSGAKGTGSLFEFGEKGVRGGARVVPAEKRIEATNEDGSFRRRLFRNPFAARERLVPARRMVQGQLSLESIKVVRNDLSDSDLELVSCEKRTKNNEESQAGLGEGSARSNPKFIWGRLSARLFASDRAQV